MIFLLIGGEHCLCPLSFRHVAEIPDPAVIDVPAAEDRRRMPLDDPSILEKNLLVAALMSMAIKMPYAGKERSGGPHLLKSHCQRLFVRTPFHHFVRDTPHGNESG